MHVVIIGAGWAGLAAAVELSRKQIQVTLIEAAQHAGGRARSVAIRENIFDNGQHLMMGAYREMLRLLRIIGMNEERAFHRRRLCLEMRSPHRDRVRVEFPARSAPWHVIAGFTNATGLSRSERYHALALCVRLFFSGFKLDRDASVAEWLVRNKQSPLLSKALWEPLCLAALNTPLDQASAEVFIRVLREVFAGRRSDSDMLFPRLDLGSVFPEPAVRFIQAQGGAVHFGERALALYIRDGRMHGVTTRLGKIDADHGILAVSAIECLRLIQPHSSLNDIHRRLSAFRYEPICTVYLQYPPEVRLAGEMTGLLDGTGQWILDLGNTGHPGRMAVVISGPGPHMAWDNDALIARIRLELTQHYPQWPAPLHTFAIREKRATYSCHAGINALRPAVRTSVQGCWLAGDYTDTGLPATLEGAVRSGVQCARQIISG